jgi:hypothetical protein
VKEYIYDENKNDKTNTEKYNHENFNSELDVEFEPSEELKEIDKVSETEFNPRDEVAKIYDERENNFEPRSEYLLCKEGAFRYIDRRISK